MPWLQPGVWGGPSSLGVRAANSLYWLDATADEGAAGRPEVQEGQAGRSGQSGLATGIIKQKTEDSRFGDDNKCTFSLSSLTYGIRH